MDNLKWRWALGLKGELKIENYFIYDLRVFNEGDDSPVEKINFFLNLLLYL